MENKGQMPSNGTSAPVSCLFKISMRGVKSQIPGRYPTDFFPQTAKLAVSLEYREFRRRSWSIRPGRRGRGSACSVAEGRITAFIAAQHLSPAAMQCSPCRGLDPGAWKGQPLRIYPDPPVKTGSAQKSGERNRHLRRHRGAVGLGERLAAVKGGPGLALAGQPS